MRRPWRMRSKHRLERREPLGHSRRADGDDLFHPRFSIWTGAHMVCHVTRRPASAILLPRSREISHAGCGHLGRGPFRCHPAGIFDIGTLADLSNIGTLFAFYSGFPSRCWCCASGSRSGSAGFRVPWTPFIPIASVVSCFILMASLTVENWLRFFRVASDRPRRLSLLRSQAQPVGRCESAPP